ncbi:mitochondrial thiamine pyrophosphate carrier isoform X1 [Lasioglossum baleicum]|uniref:mitochondrial thiamine pyrophosphate carrier isoform X1 n=1 Tax=Lasioglossum baleicum TaxID=434251 RepID=UPI003FCDB9C5
MSVSLKANDHNTDHAIAGASSGFLTRFSCQPLDVVKIRFQLQVEPIKNHHVSKYHSIAQTFSLIIKEEGVLALWKGHVPAQILSVVYGTGQVKDKNYRNILLSVYATMIHIFQFYSFNIFLKAFKNLPQLEEWKFTTKFVAGAGAGCVATIVSFPFDTMRTRLVAQSNKDPIYKGVLHCCGCIVRHESPRAFFNGLLPTLLQIVPHSGLQFAFYGLFSDLYKKYSSEANISFYNSMISGSAAGLLSKTMVYPLDLSRKRLQIQGFQHGRKGFGSFFSCTGLLDCLRLTVKVEGVRGLFKGLVPSQIKAAATTALHFTTYEQSLALIKAVRELYNSETK